MEIENRVIEKIRQRQEIGIKKYGISVKDNPAGILEWLNHLQEELLDAAIYNEKLKDIVSNLVEARVIMQNAITKRIEELERELIKIEDITSPIFIRTEGKRDELERLLKQIVDGSILSK